MSRAVMQQALEALVAAYQGKDKTGQVTEAITALRAALAEPEQEPVAWIELTDEEQLELARDSMGRSRHWLVAQVEAKLKEKNSAPTPRKPQTTHWEGCEAVHPECRKQEPVAWMSQGGDVARSKRYLEKMGFSNLIPLYTAPTPRKPLTDEEIDRVTDQQWAQNNHKPIYAAHRAYARAIERAHGIGEQHGS